MSNTTYYTVANMDADGGMHYVAFTDENGYVQIDDDIIDGDTLRTVRDIKQSSVWHSIDKAQEVAGALDRKFDGDFQVVKL